MGGARTGGGGGVLRGGAVELAALLDHAAPQRRQPRRCRGGLPVGAGTSILAVLHVGIPDGLGDVVTVPGTLLR